MFRVNKRRIAAHLLGLCNHMQGDGRFAGRLRSVNLYHTSPGNAAYP